jgi:serine/threonine protein kinase
MTVRLLLADDEQMPKLFEHIMKKPHDFPSPEWDAISPEAKDLVNKMLEKDPHKRLVSLRKSTLELNLLLPSL